MAVADFSHCRYLHAHWSMQQVVRLIAGGGARLGSSASQHGLGRCTCVVSLVKLQAHFVQASGLREHWQSAFQSISGSAAAPPH